MNDVILIKNGLVVRTEKSYVSDILVKNGIISQIENNIKVEKDYQIIDASGKLIFPGGVDAHVHMELPTPAGPSSDDFYTGSKAAIAGGTTCIIDFVTPAKGESLFSALNKRKADASKSLIDYSFHMGITWWDESVKKEIIQCVKEEGITSFKTYLAYRASVGIDESELLEVMKTVAPLNALVTVHCEKGEIIDQLRKEFISQGKTNPVWHARSRPPETESESVKAVLKMAEETGCNVYIVHTSTAESIELIEDARKRGLNVYCETCPQYLLLDESVYEKPINEALAYVISPPIRAKKHQAAMWQALENGTVNVIATDHCPFNTFGQKDVGINDFTKIPNGAGGIENRLSLLYTYGVKTDKISIEKFVALTSENPAKIFGIFPQKGIIQKGSDADILIMDPNAKGIISAKKQFQNCDSNIYDGFKFSGDIETVILGGKIAFTKKILSKNLAFGKFLQRK